MSSGDDSSILGIAHSINDVPIHLTVERWDAILEKHPYDFSYHDYEMALDAVADPDYIVRANAGALFAILLLRTPTLSARSLPGTAQDGWVYYHGVH